MRRFLAMLHARNLEFLRDRAALGWNIVFPILLVVGFTVIFSNDNREIYKVGVIGSGNHPFFSSRYVQFIPEQDKKQAISKVERHQIDLLFSHSEQRYWINSTSPNGYIVEKFLLASQGPQLEKGTVTGKELRYIDWVVPGILGMNMMFSALFGIGFVLVRYRKNGVLKRLKGTPLSITEFILAQIVSRLSLIVSVAVLVYVSCDLFLDFAMHGSYLLLFLVLVMGAFSLISMGLLVAARLNSDEVAGGVVNVISWPMMLLSGVWFSLEGSPDWVRYLAELLPLTHVVEAARTIMLDGAGFFDVAHHLVILLTMTLMFLFIGVKIFRWE